MVYNHNTIYDGNCFLKEKDYLTFLKTHNFCPEKLIATETNVAVTMVNRLYQILKKSCVSELK